MELLQILNFEVEKKFSKLLMNKKIIKNQYFLILKIIIWEIMREIIWEREIILEII